jgi:very-short-patch-repair endonuclease
MFDLVVVDEASTVALSSSAPSLFRAKRAVVVGDPMQLRFVSMLSNAAQQVSIARHQISQRDQIRYKVSSTSLYDAAADAAPDQFMFLLDEHFRCAPEIIRFSNEQFYGKELRIMTERPSIDLPDSIEIRSVAGRRTDDTSGPNLLEVAEAVAVVASIITESKDLENPPSIGLLSPFRDQANALNCALVESFTPDEIARHRITCGTAHSLQGDERAIVVLSTCLDPNYASNQLAFLEKNELFNVAITRAQRKLIVISSIAEHPIGRDRLWAKFLAHVRSAAPTSGQSDRFDSLFESEVCAALRAQGFTVHTQFPSCGYFIDLVATKGSRQIAVECDGPTHFRTDGTYTDEDLIRHLTLERAGWQIIRLPYTEWMSDPLRAVERVVAALEREPSRFQPAPPALPAASASMAPTASRGRDLVRREPGKRAAKPPRAPRGSTACSCGGKWVLRKGKYGEFYGCSKFPDCRQTRQM